MTLEPSDRFIREPQRAPVELGGNLAEKKLGERRNVLEPIAQGRDHEEKSTDPKIQVSAKPLVFDHGREILVRGGDQTDIHLAVAHVAQPAESFLLEHFEELGLKRQVHVADLVEK